MTRDLDEDDVRVRPGRGSRPRTRRRPQHSKAVHGFITAIDRGRFRVALDDASAEGAGEVTAMKARELGRRTLAVGDRVEVVGDASGAPGTLARIVRIEPRRTVLRRTPDDADPVERPIVANADQLLVVTALADPPPRVGLIDRCLIAAYDAGVAPLLCLTKADLADPQDILARYHSLHLPVIVSGQADAELDPIAVAEVGRLLRGHLTALVGHSGVGKSTLANALVPAAARLTGPVNPTTGRGRHISSSAVALPLDGGGWVVDTPGVRSFGLGHVRTDRVLAAFPDLARGAADCPRDCRHQGADCALDRWVAAGHASPERLSSLRVLLQARADLAGGGP